MLNETSYLAGLQCRRRLWRSLNAPLAAAPVRPAALPVAEQIALGARQLFAGGITPAPRAVSALLDDPAVPALFGAALTADGVRVRMDILERVADGWGLRLVTSSTRVKDHHLDEVALQMHVLARAGVAVRSAEILHVDTGYVRGSAGIDWAAYFIRVEVGALAAARPTAPVQSLLDDMQDCLALSEAPAVIPGAHCHTPRSCGYWDECTSGKPSDWVRKLPRLTKTQADALQALGVESIAAIPTEFPLSARQHIIRTATRTGQAYVAPDLCGRLEDFRPPCAYLDFEAMAPAIPLHADTRPYQTIPFQWSLHSIDQAGALEHCEFLAEAQADPRRRFAETLIEALARCAGPVLVYSAYEASRLKDLAEQLPDLRAPIELIIRRLRDLLPVVRSAVYLPGFEFSNSIKSVAPALSPGFGYDDLDGIADGLAAASAFVALADGSVSDAMSIARSRAALLAYCERDTLAMVAVHRALSTLAASR